MRILRPFNRRRLRRRRAPGPNKIPVPMRIVIKCGSSLLTGPDNGFSVDFVANICTQIAALYELGHQPLLVSSGAVATGAGIVGRSLEVGTGTLERQVLAAIGQGPLIATYRTEMARFDRLVAQALLSRSDLERRSGYLNARNTCLTLLGMGVLPIVNENDVVATEELQFGDNDRLSALAANLIDADLLFILTDVEGFLARKSDGQMQVVPEISDLDPELYRAAGASSGPYSVGGMRSKLDAAKLAQSHGAETVIASGREPEVIVRLAAGERIGTRFPAKARRTGSRRRWMLADFGLAGDIEVDSGAVRALREKSGSLLPAGVVSARGDFERGDLVSVKGPDGTEVARGLPSYGRSDVCKIAGADSNRIRDLLGYEYGAEVVHRNNMVIL